MTSCRQKVPQEVLKYQNCTDRVSANYSFRYFIYFAHVHPTAPTGRAARSCHLNPAQIA